MDITLLLFSSMLNPAELYLSRESKNKEKSTKNQIKNSNSKISKNFDKELASTSLRDRTIDSEIEDAIEQIISPETDNIAEVSSKTEKNEHFAPNIISYATQVKNFFTEIKSAFKSLYWAVVNYAKSSYKTKEKQKKNNDTD